MVTAVLDKSAPAARRATHVDLVAVTVGGVGIDIAGDQHTPIKRDDFAILLAAGCTKTKVFTTAPFTPGAEEPVTRRAPRDAVYKVKWFDPAKRELHTVHGTERAVFAGQRIGFAPRPEGGVLAYAGDEEFPIERLSPRAAYCIWVAKVKKPTRLTEGLRTTGAVITTGAGLVAGGTAAGFVNGVLDGDDECEDEE